MASHDLLDFFQSSSEEITKEYQRIQKRVSEDPGTAGDQGEENWATLLRNWLPQNLQIVTKGRILTFDGIAGPQMDILILRPEYPKILLDKKVYMSGGVLAAFECKITLRPKHIDEFFKRSIEVKSHLIINDHSPYSELHSDIIFGLLAHSHLLTKTKTPIKKFLRERLIKLDEELVTHPRFCPELICIADSATAVCSKFAYMGYPYIKDETEKIVNDFDEGVQTFYTCGPSNLEPHLLFTPISLFLLSLYHKLAYKIEGMRPLSKYFLMSNITPTSSGSIRNWPISVYSDAVQAQVLAGRLGRGGWWDKWDLSFR